MEKKRKLKRYTVSVDSETFAISLVAAPAIEVEAVALAKQEPQQMYFSDEDKHLLISPILIPNKDIYRTNGDMEYYLSFTEESIEAMSRKYMRQMRQKDITLQHEEPVEGVTLIETWLTADNYQDKAHFYGFDVPKGTWMGTFYVDSNDIWRQVKDGSIKGVSVEAMIGLEEEFSKQDNMNIIDLSDMSSEDFLNRIGQMIKDAWNSKEEVVEDTVNVAMEETPTVTDTVAETVVEAPEEPITPEVVEQPKVEEIAAPEPKEEPVKEDSHLQELIKNLQAEIEALKQANAGLNDKVKEMSHEPSAKPITVNGKPNGGGDAYQQWRSTMKEMLGR